MNIDPNRTFNALSRFNQHITHPVAGEEKYLLKVSNDDGVTFLEVVPQSDMSFWQRFLSIFGASSFNLNNVLEVAGKAATMPTIVANAKDILTETATNLRNKVTAHYQSHLGQKRVAEKIANINSLARADVIAQGNGPQGIAPAVNRQKVTETVVSKTYSGTRTVLQYQFPFDFYGMASSTFSPRDKTVLERASNPFRALDKTVSPDPRIVEQLSARQDFHKYDQNLYRDIVKSLSGAWNYNAELLLVYVEANQQELEKMFDGKPMPIEIRIDQGGELSAAQIRLLELLPITTVRLDGNPERRVLPRISQIQQIIPTMQKLTCVDARWTRFLPPEFYESLSKITEFSARIASEQIKDLANMPNLKKLTIEVENSGCYDHNETLTLKGATNLEELILNGGPRNVDVTECIANMPNQCHNLRLRSCKYDIEKLIQQFRENPLDTLYLENYSKEDVEKLKQAKIAHKIVSDNGFGHTIPDF